MKTTLLVIMLSVIAVSTSAQTMVTVKGITANVEIELPVVKALKLAVNSGILARTNSTLTVTNADNTVSIFTVIYSGSYSLTETTDIGLIIETYESTRVADIRTEILQWLDIH